MTEGLDREGVPWLDLLPAFRADPRCLYRNTHWNDKGHRLAAAQIFGEVCAVAREELGACTQEAQFH